jgi:hypothetical protein
VEEQFLLIALLAFGKPHEDFEASLQMSDGFQICRTLCRPLARPQPIVNRPFEKSRFGQVPGEKFRLC